MGHPRFGRFVAALLLTLLAAYATSGEPTPPPASSSGRTVTCALSNPGYSGWCRQSVAVPAGSTPRRACREVLACLNDERCAKNYCNQTQVRGGWRLEKVERTAR